MISEARFYDTGSYFCFFGEDYIYGKSKPQNQFDLKVRKSPTVFEYYVSEDTNQVIICIGSMSATLCILIILSKCFYIQKRNAQNHYIEVVNYRNYLE